MRAATSTPWLATALFSGTAFLIAGCSAEPVRQPEHGSEAEAKVAIPGAPVVTSPTKSNNAEASQPVTDPQLTVDGEGLRWFVRPSGSARPIPFGTSQNEVLASLVSARGPADQGTNQDCGAGPVQYATWPDGLSLVFQDDRFVGWGLDRRAANAIATAAGIGPGSTRVALDAAYSATVSQTSLGTEFSAGDLHGVLDGRSAGAKITDMWAGVSCVAR